MAGGITIPVSAELDQGDVDKAIQEFTSQVNRLGQAVAQANRVKFNPVDRAATEDMRRLERQFESLLRINASLRQRLKSTGQEGLPFAAIDWQRAYADTPQRGRAMMSAFDYVTRGTGLGGRFAAVAQPPAPPAPQGGGGAGGGGGGGFPGQGIVNAGLNAAGPIGGVASGALGAGLRGGFMAGLAGLAGGLAALGVGKLVGSVREKLGSAEQEAIGYDSLKRLLGDVNVEFEHLRGGLRQTATALGMTYNESLKLGNEFARQSGMRQGQYRTLMTEVGIGAGMGRSFGLDPGSGVGFLGRMRLAGATSNEDGSKRLALMIGEAVARVGFSKADELMQAVSTFSLQVARVSFNAPNFAGYTGALAGLVGSGRPGLDVTGAAGLLDRANAAIVGGGGAGEAGQNFMLAAIGRRLGLSPIQTRIMLQGGAFGTGAAAFGPGSLFAKFSGQRLAAGGSTVSNLQMITEGLRASFGHLPPEMLANAAGNLLGLNESQAMALMTYGRGGAMNGVEARLRRAGVRLGSLNPTAFGALARINTGSMSDLQAQARSLMNRTGYDSLNRGERERLSAAMASGNIETMRDVLTELTATREQEMTEGKATRDSINKVENVMTDLATKLIPVTNTMRDALVAMAGVIAPESMFGKAAKEVAAIKARDRAAEDFDAQLAAFDAETETRRAELMGQRGFNAERFDEMRARARLNLEARRGLQMGHLGAGLPASDALFAALIQQESGGRHIDPRTGRLLRNETSGALGITQVMPDTGRAPGFGVRPLQDDSEEEYRRFGRDYLNAMLRRYGGDKSKALAAYNWGPGNVDMAIGTYGPDWLQSAPAETQRYVSNITRNESMYSGAAPGQANRGRVTSGPASAEVDLYINAKDRQGRPIAAPARARVSVPQPQGVQPEGRW